MVRVVCGAAIAVFAVASQEDGCTPAYEDPSENPFGCCPFLEEVEQYDFFPNKVCLVPHPPAGQEYAQCSGPPQWNTTVEECNSGLDCRDYDRGDWVKIGFCVDPPKQVQFADGVGCQGVYDDSCCNTCPDGYEPILDVKVCAAAAEFFSHSLMSSVRCPVATTTATTTWAYETLPWKSKVQEINVDRRHPFGCALSGAGGCNTVAVNNNTQVDMSDCDHYTQGQLTLETRVYCQLSNASGSDFTV